MHGPTGQRIAPSIASLLAGLRRRVRRYIWLEAAAMIIVAAALAFWVSLAIDWFFEPSALVRVGVLIACVVAVGAVAVYYIRRARTPLPDRSMALLLERRFAEFNDSLLTSVELAEPGDHFEYNEAMLAETARAAESRGRSIDATAVLRPAPLAWRSLAASGLMATLVLLAVAAPYAYGVWTSRMLMLSNELWPRATRLIVEGFENGEAVVARGGDLDLIVLADASMVVPDTVEIRSRTDDGHRERKPMVRIGEAQGSGAKYQEFKYEFRAIPNSIEFDVVGGDDRRSGLRIRVVEPPVIENMVLVCDYPPYTGRGTRELDVSGATQLPQGTRIALHARANKELTSVGVRRVGTDASDDSLDWQTTTFEERSFSFELGALDRDMLLDFTLTDTDGVKNRATIRLAITAMIDAAPEIKARPEGVGTAITSQARVPIVGEIRDDYGLRSVWLEYSVDGSDPVRIDLHSLDAARAELALAEVFDVANILSPVAPADGVETAEVEMAPLRPGQRLSARLGASDAFQLPEQPGPHIGFGEQFHWDIVTPDQLRAMLEAREMNLRQRFEQIITEMIETRDSLAAVRIEGESPDEPAAVPTVVREPGEDSDDSPSTAEQIAARNRMRVQGAAQGARKSAEETRGVALSFDGIRAELVNNRLDSEELKIRLQDQIAEPLKTIAGPLFADLSRRIEAFSNTLTDPAAGPAARREAVAQADKIVVEMQKVRDKMLELETFNEAVDLLRSIVTAQDELRQKTAEERKKSVRSLLED